MGKNDDGGINEKVSDEATYGLGLDETSEQPVTVHINDYEPFELSPDEKRLRSEAAWRAQLAMEKEQGERVMMPDPYRSIVLDMFGHGSILDDVNKIIIEQSYERLLQETQASAEAVATARIAQLKNIGELSQGYSTLVNVILSMAEALQVKLRVTTYTDKLVPHTYDRDVKVGDVVSPMDLRHIGALIVAKASAAIEQEKSLAKQIAELERKISEQKLKVATQSNVIASLQSAPKGKPIEGLRYCIAGQGISKKTSLPIQLYAHEKDGVWVATTSLSNATKYKTLGKVSGRLAWLRDNPSLHDIKPQTLNSMAVHTILLQKETEE